MDAPAQAVDRRAGGGATWHALEATPRRTTAQRERAMLRQVLWVGIGGFFGANARVLVANWVTAWLGALIPYGTLIVNLSGCLLLGFLMGALEARPLPPVLRPALATGFIGAYTTFSTFEYETVLLIRDGSPFLATVYVLGSLFLGLAAVWLGLLTARALG